MNILYYCQHVLGVGHFFRSLEIARALAPHPVTMVLGGKELSVPLPGHVRALPLPGLMMTDDFSAMYSVDGRPLEQVKAERASLLAAHLEAGRPDVFLVELFPFGRNQFRFELAPALEAIRAGRAGRCRAVCSLRDILVEKADQEKYERRVLAALNSLFDLLLVHADPRLQALDETFRRVGDIIVPWAYTGFVTARPSPGARERVRAELGLKDGEPLTIASAGGGAVGERILFAALEGFARLREPRGRLLAFGGPYLPAGTFRALQARAAQLPGARAERFSDRFLDLLAAADLSISQAGYNTCMNLLAAGPPALVWPFAQNREQRLRAEKLQALGVLSILEDADLDADILAGRMAAALERGRAGGPPPVNLDGAADTARRLRELVEGP